MHGDNKQDIPKLDYMFLSLISSRVRIGILGGGKAALIKLKSLVKKECNIAVLSKEFHEEVESFKHKGVTLQKGEYYKGFLEDKHLIFICIDDETIVEEIIRDCDSLSKLYVNSSNSKNSLAVLPIQNNNGSFSYAVNTNGGNPKMSRMILREIGKSVDYLKGLTDFSGNIRAKMKETGVIDKNILGFIASEEYKFFFERGKGIEVLYLYFDKIVLNSLLGEDFILYGGNDHESDNSYKKK